jgi:hypothetical protein
LLAVVGGLFDEFCGELLLPQPPPAVFGGLFPLFPLLQSSESFGFTFETGAVGEGLQPTATNSDATVREARRRLMIRSPMLDGVLRAGLSEPSPFALAATPPICGGREERQYAIGVSCESDTT